MVVPSYNGIVYIFTAVGKYNLQNMQKESSWYDFYACYALISALCIITEIEIEISINNISICLNWESMELLSRIWIKIWFDKADNKLNRYFEGKMTNITSDRRIF